MAERRADNFCQQHNRQIDDIDKLQSNTNKIYGWQKAQAYFIGICFTLVVVFASNSSSAISEMSKSVSKMDKQIAVLVSRDETYQTTTNRRMDRIEKAVEKIVMERGNNVSIRDDLNR